MGGGGSWPFRADVGSDTPNDKEVGFCSKLQEECDVATARVVWSVAVVRCKIRNVIVPERIPVCACVCVCACFDNN